MIYVNKPGYWYKPIYWCRHVRRGTFLAKTAKLSAWLFEEAEKACQTCVNRLYHLLEEEGCRYLGEEQKWGRISTGPTKSK